MMTSSGVRIRWRMVVQRNPSGVMFVLVGLVPGGGTYRPRRWVNG